LRQWSGDETKTFTHHPMHYQRELKQTLARGAFCFNDEPASKGRAYDA
jgi:hypothetical protein